MKLVIYIKTLKCVVYRLKGQNKMKNLKIRDVRTILTAPEGIALVVVKVETTEPDYMVWVVLLLLSDH